MRNLLKVGHGEHQRWKAATEGAVKPTEQDEEMVQRKKAAMTALLPQSLEKAMRSIKQRH